MARIEEALAKDTLIPEAVVDCKTITEFQSNQFAIRMQMIRKTKENVASMLNNKIEPTAEDITLTLKELVSLGLSQKSIANAIGTSTGTISRWITGEVNVPPFVRLSIMIQLADIIDYSLSRLSKFSEKLPPTRPRAHNIVGLKRTRSS